MTDPLIELAREAAAIAIEAESSQRWALDAALEIRSGFYDEGLSVQSALSALRTQQAMIVELARIEADEVQSLGQNPTAAKALRKFADQIEQDEYLKGRG